MARARDRSAHRVDHEVRNLYPAALVQLVTAEQSAYARQQLAEVERFRQVVIGADIEAAHAVLHGIARRQHEDRHGVSPQPDGAADLPAIGTGQHQVQDDEVELLYGSETQSLGAIRHALDVEVRLLEPAADELRDRLIVLDEKYPHNSRLQWNELIGMVN